MTQQTLTHPYGPQRGGFASPEVMRGVIAVKLGIPLEFVELHVDGGSVTFWDTRTVYQEEADHD
jgi:hypothetical protein